MSTVNGELRRYFFEVQNGECFYCEVKMTKNKKFLNEDNYFTLDHIIPRSKNGSWKSVDNLIGCCKKCNHSKNDEIQEFNCVQIETLNNIHVMNFNKFI